MTNSGSTPPTLSSEAPCPCGTGKSFAQCCGPLLKQERVAQSAGELMRSRFTAHAVRDYRHLHRTYLATAKQPYVEEAGGGQLTWTRLVIHQEDPGATPETAYVDFTAYYEDAGAERALDEKSEFVRMDGTWFYRRTVRNGPAPIKSTAPKIGRNEPCPCGSGKKFKHCCGR